MKAKIDQVRSLRKRVATLKAANAVLRWQLRARVEVLEEAVKTHTQLIDTLRYSGRAGGNP